MSGSYDKTIKIWDPITGLNIKTVGDNNVIAKLIRCSPNGTTMTSISLDKSIKIWDIVTGNIIKT
jgi:WD40 repeat protein